MAIRLICKGKVQGVGFRWTVVEHAQAHSLVGTVTNLSNGDVECIAEGEKKDISLFLQAIKESPGFAKITEMQSSYILVTDSYADFRIT